MDSKVVEQIFKNLLFKAKGGKLKEADHLTVLIFLASRKKGGGGGRNKERRGHICLYQINLNNSFLF